MDNADTESFHHCRVLVDSKARGYHVIETECECVLAGEVPILDKIVWTTLSRRSGSALNLLIAEGTFQLRLE